MKCNIVDIAHFLTLTPCDSAVQDSGPVRHGSMTKSKSIQFGSTEYNRDTGSIGKWNRNPSTKNLKKSTTVYEIADNRKIILYQQPSAISFNYDGIEQMGGKFENGVNWLLDRARDGREMEVRVACKVMLAHNFTMRNCVELVQGLGKKLILDGIGFDIATHFYRTKKGRYQDADVHKQPSLNFCKTIKFVSDLRQYLTDIKSLNRPISKFTLKTPSIQLIIVTCESYDYELQTRLIKDLMADYQNSLQRESKGKSVSFKFAVCTVCDPPSLGNLEACKEVLEDSILIRNSVKKFAIEERGSFEASKSLEESGKKSRSILKDKNKKLDETRTRKNSKIVQYRQSSTQLNQRRHSNKEIKVSDISQTSSEKQNEPRMVPLNQLLNHVNANTNGSLADIKAENLNLKWQLQVNQKEYELQSQKFVSKMNKKLETLRQERAFTLQENARLRKDNEQLLHELTQIKAGYDQLMLTKLEQQKVQNQKYKLNEQTLIKSSQTRIHELQDEVKKLSGDKEYLEKQVINLRASLEDARKRNRERVEEANGEIQQYRKFSEELKASYEDLERQARLDQDRCENLEKRCKKYQETLSDLLKMKLGTPSEREGYSSKEADSIRDLSSVVSSQLKAEQSEPPQPQIRMTKQKKEVKNIKKWSQSMKQEQQQQSNQNTDRQPDKQKQPKKKKGKQKPRPSQPDPQQKHHNREISFKDNLFHK